MQYQPSEKNFFQILPNPIIKASDSRLLYVTNSLRTFAESLIGLFIPIFLFENMHFTLPFFELDPINTAFIGIFLVYGFKSFFSVLFMHQMVNLIFGKFNFRSSIIIGNILLGLGIFSLGASKDYPYLLLPAIIFLSLNGIFYWIPYHTIFIRKAVEHDGKFGKNVGTKQVFERVAAVAGPLIGAMIISLFGFQVLFIIGFIILTASGLPLAYVFKEPNHGKHNSYETIKKYLRKKSHYNDTIAFAAMGMDNVLFAILSPMLIFFVSDQVSVLGVITSFSIATSILLTFRIGKMVDEKGPAALQRIGITINTALYIVRAFTINPYILYSSDFLDRLNSNLLSIPFISSMYTHARRGHHESDFVIYRAYVTDTAIVVAMIFSIIFVISIKNWQLLFLFLAAISPLTYAINANQFNLPSKGRTSGMH